MNRGITIQEGKFPLAARVLVLMLALSAQQVSEAGELRLYVSPTGNDAWSGTLAEPNAEKSDGPLASLERARDEIRKRKKAGGLPDGGVTVLVGGGVYERSKTFELGVEDSGTNQAAIVYRGQPGAEVRLIGGKRVTAITGNVFYQVPRAAFIGGGRDCLVQNNVFVDCNPALHIDARALGWAGYHAQMWIKEGREKGSLSGTRFRDPPYRDRYPPLVGILEDDPAAPKGNVVARNICWQGRWDEIEAKARPLVTIKDNLVNVDPHFVDAASLDFRLRDDSPAWKLGFQRIPFEKIGLYRSDERASWPVPDSQNPGVGR